MTMYLMTPEQHAQIVDVLDTIEALFTSMDIQHLFAYREVEASLAMLKAMKPVTPACYGWRGKDGAVRDCIAPDTHQIIEGQYNVPLYLYAKEQQ